MDFPVDSENQDGPNETLCNEKIVGFCCFKRELLVLLMNHCLHFIGMKKKFDVKCTCVTYSVESKQLHFNVEMSVFLLFLH